MACRGFALWLGASLAAQAAGAWQTVGNAGFSADAASCTSLAFGLDGKPYVAYRDRGNGSKATVMRLKADSTGWDGVGAPDQDTGYTADTTIAFSPAGVLYLVSWDWESGPLALRRFDPASTHLDEAGQHGDYSLLRCGGLWSGCAALCGP